MGGKRLWTGTRRDKKSPLFKKVNCRVTEEEKAALKRVADMIFYGNESWLWRTFQSLKSQYGGEEAIDLIMLEYAHVLVERLAINRALTKTLLNLDPK